MERLEQLLRTAAARAAIAAAVVVTVVVALTVAATGFDRTTSSATASPSARASTPKPAPSPTATGPAPLGALTSYLLPVPPGGVRDSSAYAQLRTLTLQQFVAHFYDAADQSKEIALFEGDGLQSIAHVEWERNGVEQDILLFEFADDYGAVDRYDALVTAVEDDTTLSLKPVTLTGLSDARAFRAPTLDSDSQIRSRVYVRRGRIVMQQFEFSPGSFDQPDLQTYAIAQAARLPATS